MVIIHVRKNNVFNGSFMGNYQLNSHNFYSNISRDIQVLTSTDVAGMGVHVYGLNLVVNIGKY